MDHTLDRKLRPELLLRVVGVAFFAYLFFGFMLTPCLNIFTPLMSKYSVSSTMDTPTMLTVTTRHSASFREFQTYVPILPARKKRMTAQGSRSPAAFTVLNTLVRVDFLLPDLYRHPQPEAGSHAQAAQSGKELPALYFCVGQEDGFHQENLEFMAHLDKLGIRHTDHEQPGIHNWDFWDDELRRILQWLPVERRDPDRRWF